MAELRIKEDGTPGESNPIAGNTQALVERYEAQIRDKNDMIFELGLKIEGLKKEIQSLKIKIGMKEKKDVSS